MARPLTPVSSLAASLSVVLLLGVSPARADQFKQAADGAGIDCAVSAHELTRFALVDDQFASVSKIATGYPYNDFAVTNEPVRGDIYVSVPDTFAARTISFFATTKKGYVYKFGCHIDAISAQQVFITNPAIAGDKDQGADTETPPDQAAVSLIQAMANDGLVPGFTVRQSSDAPKRVGDLEVQLIAEYLGSRLTGKAVRLVNRSSKPVTVSERDLSPRDTLAAAITNPVLEPGAATIAYVVGAAGDRSHD